MIPTAIFINDGNNSELLDLASQMQQICRVIQRTSLQGEQLYKIFEGVLFLNSNGQVAFTRQDEYGDTIKAALFHLYKLDSKSKRQLLKYLNKEATQIPIRGDLSNYMDNKTFDDFIAFRGSLTEENV